MINWGKLHKIAGKSKWEQDAKKRRAIPKEVRQKHTKLALKILNMRKDFSYKYIANKLGITIDELNLVIHGNFLFGKDKLERLLNRIYKL